MKTRCVIIDDEELARTLLINYIRQTPELELVGSYKSPMEVFNDFDELKIDLVFLDIQMPEITGIEFMRIMKKSRPLFVFTTAYPQYALEGFNLDVVDYLVKPFPFERFLHCIHKVKAMLDKRGSLADENPAYLMVNSGHKIYKLALDEILYIEGLREYVSYYTEDKKRIIALDSLKNLESRLAGSNFIRVHKSYLVNAGKIKVINNNQLVVGDKEIPVGKSFRDQAMTRLLREEL